MNIATQPYTDETELTFGKYKGWLLGNVPAKYLLWYRQFVKHKGQDVKLQAYIEENLEAIKMEYDG